MEGMQGKKTIVGLLVSALGLIFMTFDIEITAEETQDVINKGMILIGLLQSLYGRVVAKGPIKLNDTRKLKFKGFTDRELLMIMNYAKTLRDEKELIK